MIDVVTRRPLLAIVAALAVVAALGVFGRPDSADAHPLGNFTVNRYSRIELYSDVVRVHYVLDMAEIPSFQEIGEIDTDGDDQFSAAENEAYIGGKLPELLSNITLTIDGEAATLTDVASDIAYPEGQAGLDTLRLSAVFEAQLTSSVGTLEYRDDNYADRVGWKEIVIAPAAGVLFEASTAATVDVSAELTAYPDDLLSSPLDVTSASLSFDASAGRLAPSGAEVAPAPESAVSRAGGGFAGLIDARNLTFTAVLLAIIAAFGFGALHALEPGHGKTLVAAYFVGVKGSARQAVGLGAVIAGTHTIGVLIIGGITLFLSQYILPEHLYPWLSLASGLMILVLGIRLFVTRARTFTLGTKLAALLGRSGAGERQLAHEGVAHEHTHDDHSHEHGNDHGHTHEVVPGSPWRTLFALGLADGLTPSPSALIVLLAAVSLDRIGLGIGLIVAFSIGLATVLTAVCLALVYARRFLEWVSARRERVASTPVLGWATAAMSPDGAMMRVVPVAGALALVAVGSVLTLRALSAPMLSLF